MIVNLLSLKADEQINIVKPLVYPTSKKVEFSIKMKAKYGKNEPISMIFIWKNKSSKVEKIMLKEGWGHPLMLGVLIKNEKNEELTKYATRHFLMSQIYQNDELKKYEIKLSPKEEKRYSVNLLSIPVFRDGVLNENGFLKDGRYKVQAYYYEQKSNIAKIIIDSKNNKK